MKSLLCYVFIVVIVVIVIAVGICLYLASRTALDAEKRFHAVLMTISVVESFVKSHDGNWPMSWEELEKSAIGFSGDAYFSWPADSAKIQAIVEIDFSSSAFELVRQGIDAFQPIRQRAGPSYDYFTALDSLFVTLCIENGLQEDVIPDIDKLLMQRPTDWRLQSVRDRLGAHVPH